MKGTQNETRNQMKNELPLTLPTIPPASPKKNRITSRPRPCMAPGLRRPAPLEERLERPENGDDRRDDNRGPENCHHQADREMNHESGGGDQHQPGGHLPQDRGP